jgi:hypothetical protein
MASEGDERARDEGDMIGEVVRDAVGQAYEHYDVDRIIGASVTLVLLTAKGKTEFVVQAGWNK